MWLQKFGRPGGRPCIKAVRRVSVDIRQVSGYHIRISGCPSTPLYPGRWWRKEPEDIRGRLAISDNSIINPHAACDPVQQQQKQLHCRRKSKICSLIAKLRLKISEHSWHILEIDNLVVVVAVWILCERPFGANVALFSLFFSLFFSLIQLWVVEPPASCEGGPAFQYLLMCTKLESFQLYNSCCCCLSSTQAPLLLLFSWYQQPSSSPKTFLLLRFP